MDIYIYILVLDPHRLASRAAEVQTLWVNAPLLCFLSFIGKVHTTAAIYEAFLLILFVIGYPF